MTVIAHRIPTQHTTAAPSGIPGGHGVQLRRGLEADRRRQEALARLTARRMPLPGRAACDPRITVLAPTVPDTTTAELARPALTGREVEVLRTWLMLDSKPAVAQHLYISLGTVNTHLTRIRAKYAEIGRAASTKAALVARAVQDGLIALDEL